MRAKNDPKFCEYLIRFSDGKEKQNDYEKIEIPHSLLIPFTSEKESLNVLLKSTYLDLCKFILLLYLLLFVPF